MHTTYTTKKWTLFLLSAALVLGTLSGCGTIPASDLAADTASSAVQLSSTVPSDTAVPRTAATVELTDAVSIQLDGASASSDGDGITVDGGHITITRGGTYVISGTLTDGSIVVNAPDEDVTLVLNGASITCSDGSPLYIYKAKTATVHLMDGTENALTDGETYAYSDAFSSAADEEPNACLYSKADLVLQGSGSLTVTANANNGITSKDTLALYDGIITVSAVNHGINGKDSCTADSVTLTVTAGGDALRSTNDSDETMGWVQVTNSTLHLTAGEDGIQAETWASLASSTVSVTSGGGSSAETAEDSASAKGIKAGTDLTIQSGSYTLDCRDDTLHANGNVIVSGGTLTLSSGDDGVHADGTLTVSNGTIDIRTCYEGLEGAVVDVSGGTVSIVSSDDGVNASDGTSQGFGGPNMGGNDNCALNISGGTLSILAGGDGLDSNGTLDISGGAIVVSSTGNDDGALDSDGAMTLTGGVLFAPSLGGMIQMPDTAAQCTLSVGFGQTLEAGTYVNFTVGDTSYTFQLTGDATGAVFSAPELTSGSTCTVSYGGRYSGTVTNGLCSGGTYTDGTVLTDLAVQDGVTTYGQFSGMMGGSRPGGMGGRPQDSQGTVPSDSTGQETDSGSTPAAPDGNTAPDGNADSAPALSDDSSARPEAPSGQKPTGQKPGEKPPTNHDSTTPPELPADAAQPADSTAAVLPFAGQAV